MRAYTITAFEARTLSSSAFEVRTLLERARNCLADRDTRDTSERIGGCLGILDVICESDFRESKVVPEMIEYLQRRWVEYGDTDAGNLLAAFDLEGTK